MKHAFYFIVICFAISCKSFHYYPTPPNAHTFANAGEVQASGNFSTSGFLTKGGVAITKNLSVNALYNASPGDIDGYHSKDFEGAAGWSFSEGKTKRFSIYGGYGWGSNFDLDSGETVKDFRGNYNKPFLIFNFGTARTAKRGFARGDVNVGFKFDYMMYRGFKTVYESGSYYETKFNADNFLVSPYVMVSVGGKYVRFETGTSFTFKRIVDIGRGVRVFPMQIQFGIKIILNRKYE